MFLGFLFKLLFENYYKNLNNNFKIKLMEVNFKNHEISTNFKYKIIIYLNLFN